MQANISKSQLLVYILAVPLAWGISWPIMKLALFHMPPLWMGAMRMGCSSLLVFLILFLTGKKIELLRSEIPLLISVGLGQMGLGYDLNHRDS